MFKSCSQVALDIKEIILDWIIIIDTINMWHHNRIS